MKLEKLEHKHTLTSILKVSIFSLFLLLPFIAILPSTLYFAFNEHANEYTQQTITETYEYETNEVNTVDDLIQGHIYKFYYDDSINIPYQTHEPQLSITYINFSIDDNYMDLVISTAPNEIYIVLYDEVSNVRFELTDAYNGYSYVLDKNRNIYFVYQLLDIQFLQDWDYLINNNPNLITASDYLGEKTTTITESELNPNNAFNYAFNNLENQTWFSWTKNTPLYTGLSTMTTNLGINNNVIPMILSYWLILTTIYIILDIVINLYTFITHILTGKKAG